MPQNELSVRNIVSTIHTEQSRRWLYARRLPCAGAVQDASDFGWLSSTDLNACPVAEHFSTARTIVDFTTGFPRILSSSAQSYEEQLIVKLDFLPERMSILSFPYGHAVYQVRDLNLRCCGSINPARTIRIEPGLSKCFRRLC